MKLRLPLLAVVLTAAASAGAAELPAFRTWAPTPPMGWNSWDNFGTTVTEEQTKAQADFMAEKLKSHGWQYIVVDIQWYEPHAKEHAYRAGAELSMDGFGRLTPATNRFPSAANGAGFKSLADYVHARGLKFGVHLMRGIPRQAVEKNLPVFGTKLHAQDVANRASTCPWNPDMYGVDMSKPGAQDYYDSVFALLASWGIDYVKVDDISRPYHEHEKEIEGIRRAIDRTGRPIVLSLSPGETALTAAAHAQQHANLWRISDDFWDRWLALREQFTRLANWNPYRQTGAWPDADMLPLGVLELGRHSTRFTPDEQRTMMTLWSIARSPLMHGGDMTRTDDFTLSLLTNDEVLAVNQASSNNRPLFTRDELVAWVADVPNSPDKYLAVFNVRDRVRLTPEHARYRSAPVTKKTGAVDIDVDAKGGTMLFLEIDPTDDGTDGDHALWIEPTLVFADGHEQRLTDAPWAKVDALWDNVSTSRAPGGKAMSFEHKPVAYGIGTLSPSRVEYALPKGVVRFKAKGAIDDNASADGGGAVRFVVNVATPETEAPKPAVPIAVALADLGFSGAVTVRDLWSHADLGSVSGEFAPEIPFHGAGLYRLSPAKK
ncbi:Melibiase subfamily [Opitutaceae bacterium EW11]|nr:Melibiase subfamily [Opitutaceae bacterium EW11]